jgi:hypothetical protein
MSEPLEGTVDKVAFTQGGLGNQWTTIDGRKFMTWWDIRKHAVKKGARVRYTFKENSTVCHSPLMKADTATILEILPDAGEEALDKAIDAEREKDPDFDEKRAYWDELYAQDLPAEEIAAKMKERFGE